MCLCLRYADVVSRLKVYNQLTTLKNQVYIANIPYAITIYYTKDIQKYSNVLDDWSTSDVSNMNSEISQNEENPEDRDAQDEAMENEQTGEQMQLDDAFDMQNQVEADAEMDIALNQYDYDAN